MTASRKSTRRNWRDPDDAPDLSRGKWRERMGRADVIAYFRAAGRGWQTRLNSVLWKVAGL